jgi:hypothetical protein
MPRFEYKYKDNYRITFEAESNGSETLELNGQEISSGLSPLWPGDHSATVLLDGAWVTIKLVGRTIKKNPRTYQWTLTLNGEEKTKWTW